MTLDDLEQQKRHSCKYKFSFTKDTEYSLFNIFGFTEPTIKFQRK